MKKWLLVFVCIVAMFTIAVQAAELVTPAKTIAPLGVPTSKDSKAMFSALKADALQMGLGDAVLHGLPEYQPQADGTTRVVVRWHAIGLANASATQALTQPLVSQFRTGDKSAPPGTVINVRGDLDSLAEDFLKLKARMAKESPKDTVKQTNNNSTTESARSASELGSTSGGSSSGSGNSPYSFNNNNDQLKTDLVTSTWQDCQPRIDRAGGMVYQQARKVDTTESGRLMGTGSCEDHGLTAPIVRTYDGACLPVVDIQNRKVYHQFVETADLAGKKLNITICTADFQKADEILSSTQKCGWRHDFTGGKSIRQETLYYNDLTGNMIEVRGCGDSAQAYAHYQTQNTCTPTIDSVNKQVFFNVRTAFKDADGAELYANDCIPDGNPSFAISEEFCTPKFEHDFVNHVSYYRTRAYYVDNAGKLNYVSECGRSAKDSFPHIFNGATCQVRNDDSLMQTYWNKTTQIETPEGSVEIAPCQEFGAPTPYAYVGPVTGAETLIAENTLHVHMSMRQRFPTVDWSNYANTWTSSGQVNCWKTNMESCDVSYLTLGEWVSNNTFRPVTTADQPFGIVWSMPTNYWAQAVTARSTSPAYTFDDKTYLTIRNSRYMRGDGTYYEKEASRSYRFFLTGRGFFGQ